MNLNKTLKFLTVLAFTLFLFQKNINANSYVAKKGGIAFRTDDNYKIEDILQLKTIFDPYPNFHFSIALNFAGHYNYYGSTVKFDDSSYVAMVQTLQTAGHEIMDHTPNHRTNYFITKFDSLDYVNNSTGQPIEGIDTIIATIDGSYKICLSFNDFDVPIIAENGTCTINGNLLSGNFNSYNFDTDIYIFLEGYGLFFIKEFLNNKTEALIQNVWEENVNLGIITTPVRFWKEDRAGKLSINGLTVLANETKKIALDLGIIPPTTWIQPGGRHPIISMAELSAALTPLGYTAGASFGDTPQSFKVFNEYDPDDFKKFGIQWEDFNEDHSNQNLTKNKVLISDGIAKHKVMIGHNHFYDLGTSPFVPKSEYFTKIENLLDWCKTNKIDVKTYFEWANILYEQIPDPYENVFPPLNINLDDSTNSLNPNGWPDGYYPRTDGGHGIWEEDLTAPDSSGFCYRAKGWNSRIFLVQGLGGIEKGEQNFEIWTKGDYHNNHKIDVKFKFPDNNYSPITFQFPANTANWTKYNLSKSINSNKSLIIPADVSRIEVEVFSNWNFNTSVKVSGMYLAKKKPKIPINLKIILEGSYGNNTMNIDPNFQALIPDDQPFNKDPWNYNGHDEFDNLPTGTIDWVLVELRKAIDANSMETRKAALLLNDGTIINADGTQFDIQVAEGNYYVVIHQRNHLSVMSASTVPFYDVVSN